MRQLPWRHGMTLSDVLGGARIEDLDLICEIDGLRCCASPTRPLRPETFIVLRARAGSARSLLQIGMIVASLYVPQLAVFSNLGPLGSSVLSAGILFGGQLLTNALVPQHGVGAADPLAGPENIYSLQGGRNLVRPWQPFTWVLGVHRIFPDISVQYREVVRNESYLKQIYEFGIGNLQIGDVKLESTDIDAIADKTLEWAYAGGRVTSVHGNVHSIDVAADLDWHLLPGASTPAPIVYQSPRAPIAFAVNVIATVYAISDRGEYETHGVSIVIGYRLKGQQSWSERTVSLQSSSPTPIRRAIVQGLNHPASMINPRFEVGVRLAAAPSNNNRRTGRVRVETIRFRQIDHGRYEEWRNRLGATFRASAQLSGRIGRLSALVSQRIPVWNGAEWTAPQPTSNPAWLLRAVALGVWTGSAALGTRKLIAGLGLSSDRIDDATIIRWGAFCAAEGLRCDMVVRDERVLDLLDIIARCGRAVVSWARGYLSVIWEDDSRPVTALVTPSLISLHSYQITWIGGGNLAQEIVGDFLNSANNYERAEIRRSVPDAASITRAAARIDLRGITTLAQAEAAIEGQARNQLSRRQHEWRMPLDALAADRGDALWISHSLIDGGQTGRLRGITGDRFGVDLPESVAITGESQLVITLPDGTLYQSTSISYRGTGADRSMLGIMPELPAPPPDGAWRAEDCAWRLYEDDDRRIKVFVTAVVPEADGIVRIVAHEPFNPPASYTWDSLRTWSTWSTWSAGVG